jgi:hypothetical protein
MLQFSIKTSFLHPNFENDAFLSMRALRILKIPTSPSYFQKYPLPFLALWLRNSQSFPPLKAPSQFWHLFRVRLTWFSARFLGFKVRQNLLTLLTKREGRKECENCPIVVCWWIEEDLLSFWEFWRQFVLNVFAEYLRLIFGKFIGINCVCFVNLEKSVLKDCRKKNVGKKFAFFE